LFIQDVEVLSNIEIAYDTYLLEVSLPNSVNKLFPGQFFNIQVSDSVFPLLRRPFSISDVTDNSIMFMYKVVGEGTLIMSNKNKGELLNLLGPLGNKFNLENTYEHSILIGGGIGIAPFPFLIKSFEDSRDYSVLFGVRSKKETHNYGLNNVFFSSDDGSIGMRGNVIDLLEKKLKELGEKKIKLFAIGPNPMLRALQKVVASKNLDCEVSMESVMACGFGICQGCPIEYNNKDRYRLVCKDGPVFNIRDIQI